VPITEKIFVKTELFCQTPAYQLPDLSKQIHWIMPQIRFVSKKPLCSSMSLTRLLPAPMLVLSDAHLNFLPDTRSYPCAAIKSNDCAIRRIIEKLIYAQYRGVFHQRIVSRQF
jgi:hypothetical protein